MPPNLISEYRMNNFWEKLNIELPCIRGTQRHTNMLKETTLTIEESFTLHV